MTEFEAATSNPGDFVTHTQPVPTSMARVWQVISTPGILSECHPFCQDNPVEKWPGVGSRDQVHYYNGLVLEREFINWIEGVGYDLIASSEDGMRFKVSWRINAGEDDQSCLTLTITQHFLQVSDKKARQFNRLLGNYLEQAMKGFEYYIRTGMPVVRNQFGSHHQFSPPVPIDD